MRTTIDLPDLLFREVKATAAHQGMHLKDYITEALAWLIAQGHAVEETTGPCRHAAQAKVRFLQRQDAAVAHHPGQQVGRPDAGGQELHV